MLRLVSGVSGPIAALECFMKRQKRANAETPIWAVRSLCSGVQKHGVRTIEKHAISLGIADVPQGSMKSTGIELVPSLFLGAQQNVSSSA